MANSIVGQFIGTKMFKVIHELTGYECWRGLRVLKVEIDAGSIITDHPLASSQITEKKTYKELLDEDIKSGKVLRPVYMRVTAFCSELTTIESLLIGYNTPVYTYSVTTKEVIVDSMTLSTLEVEHSDDNLSSSKLVIEFEQVEPIATNSFKPEQSADESVYGMRIQQSKSLPESASDLYDKVRTEIKGVLA